MYQLLSGHYVSITLNNDLLAPELPKRVNIIPKSTTEYLGNLEEIFILPECKLRCKSSKVGVVNFK